MTSRALGLMGLGVALLLVVWTLLGLGPEAGVVIESSPRPSREGERGEELAPLPSYPSASDRVSGRPELRVVGAAKVPLRGATVAWVANQAGESTLAQTAFGISDANGLVPWVGPPQGTDLLLVRASGHVPRLVSGPFVEVPQEVELSEAAILEVEFVDTSGRPIPGVRAMLEPQFRAELGSMRDPTGIGHPLSPVPRWRFDSDGVGLVRFSELPAGEYFLNALHGSMVPMDGSGANGQLRLTTGMQHVTIVMLEGHGAVVQVPSESPIRRILWRPPYSRLQSRFDIVRRIPLLRETLAEKFPEGAAYAHVLDLMDGPAEISCQVALEDGSLWRGNCDLLPLSRIEAPLFLERWDVPTRLITIVVSDKTGRLYPGIAFSLLNEAHPFDVISGAPTLVAHGTYELACMLNMRTFGQFFRRQVVVDEVSPDVVTLELGDPVARVNLNVRYPGPEVLGVCSFSLRVDGSIAGHRSNYRPDNLALEFWLPGKELTVELDSVLYKSARLGPFHLDPDKPLAIDVALEVAETKR